MKTSVSLDQQLAREISETVSLVREDTATVLRMAIRAGLPIIANRFQAERPEGYFAGAYKKYPKERAKLEEALTKMKLSPER